MRIEIEMIGYNRGTAAFRTIVPIGKGPNDLRAIEWLTLKDFHKVGGSSCLWRRSDGPSGRLHLEINGTQSSPVDRIDAWIIHHHDEVHLGVTSSLELVES